MAHTATDWRAFRRTAKKSKNRSLSASTPQRPTKRHGNAGKVRFLDKAEMIALGY